MLGREAAVLYGATKRPSENKTKDSSQSLAIGMTQSENEIRRKHKHKQNQGNLDPVFSLVKHSLVW